MKRVAKFEKVSYEQFAADYMNTYKTSDSEYVSKLYDSIELPKRSTKYSAGHDFRTPISFTLNPGETIKIPTGIRCKIDEMYVLYIHVRSSVGFKYSVGLVNQTAVVDSDYYNAANEGHIFIKLQNFGDKPFTAKEGEKICQGVFLEYGIADEEVVINERSGGIGSTGV